jgi:protein Tex
MSIFQDVAFPGWISSISKKIGIDKSVATKALRLFDEGATVPFVVRYRQHEVGGIESDVAYILHRELGTFSGVVKIRNSRIEKLKANGKYDDAIARRFLTCYTMEELDEAYSSYKESTSTKVQKALAIPGLEDVAISLMNNTIHSIQRREDEFHTALGWLIADRIAHHENTADIVSREACARNVVLTSAEKKGPAIKGEDGDHEEDAATSARKPTCGARSQQEEKAKYSDYFSFAKPLRFISTHQVSCPVHF